MGIGGGSNLPRASGSITPWRCWGECMPWAIQAGKGGEKSERASGEGVREIYFFMGPSWAWALFSFLISRKGKGRRFGKGF